MESNKSKKTPGSKIRGGKLGCKKIALGLDNEGDPEPLPELCEVCITDDEGVWVACKTCEKWFHVECAGLGNLNENEAKVVDFTCYKC